MRNHGLDAINGQSPNATQFQSFFDKAFDWFFCVFVFITIFLPGGSIYGFNYKYPIYAGLLPLALFSVFYRGQIRAGQAIVMLSVPAILSGWMILGLCNGFNVSGVIRQFTDIVLTVLLCWLAKVYCNRDETRKLRFLRLVIYAGIATAVLKIALIAFAVLRGIPVVQMVASIDAVFGVDLMTMDLGALFGRIQFVADELVPVCIYSILRHRESLRIGNLRASLFILLLLISVLFGFSRYLWAFTALACLLGILLGKRDKFQAILIAVLGLTVLASLPALITVYQLRFSDQVAGGSDQQRTEQIPALQRFFIEAPSFGHGMGSYTTEVIRGTTEAGRASYEVQLLALPAQVGIVGMCFFIVLGLYYYRDLWWRSALPWADRLFLAILLLFWVAAGLTNPLLFHPIAGVNYATLAILASVGGSPQSRSGTHNQRILTRFSHVAGDSHGHI